MTPLRASNDNPAPPLCPRCNTQTVFVTKIPKVTEPGSTALFDCPHCKKLEFRSVSPPSDNTAR